jgi:hypothetical protein
MIQLGVVATLSLGVLTALKIVLYLLRHVKKPSQGRITDPPCTRAMQGQTWLLLDRQMSFKQFSCFAGCAADDMRFTPHTMKQQHKCSSVATAQQQVYFSFYNFSADATEKFYFNFITL